MARFYKLNPKVAYNKPLRPALIGSEYSGDLFGPGTVKDEQRIVDGLVDSLNRDVQASNVSRQFKTEWSAFFREWKEFLRDNSGVLSRVLNKTYAMTLEYRERVDRWRQRFIIEGGRVSTPEPPKAGSSFGSIPFKKLLFWGAGIAGAVWLGSRWIGKDD